MAISIGFIQNLTSIQIFISDGEGDGDEDEDNESDRGISDDIRCVHDKISNNYNNLACTFL